MISVTPRCCAKPTTSSAMLRPFRVTVRAPACSASIRLSAARALSTSGDISRLGVATCTAYHSARRRAAIALAERISLTVDGLELTQTKSLASGEFAVVAIVPLNITCEHICPSEVPGVDETLAPRIRRPCARQFRPQGDRGRPCALRESARPLPHSTCSPTPGGANDAGRAC